MSAARRSFHESRTLPRLSAPIILSQVAQVLAGITLLPMVWMLVSFWLVGVPVGTWLGYHGLPGGAPMQVYGFWIGLVLGLVTVSIGLTLVLRRTARGGASLVAPAHVRP